MQRVNILSHVLLISHSLHHVHALVHLVIVQIPHSTVSMVAHWPKQSQNSMWHNDAIQRSESTMAQVMVCCHQQAITWTGLAVSHCPDGLGQVKLPVGQVDLNRFFLFYISRWKIFKFFKSGKWWFWETASPAWTNVEFIIDQLGFCGILPRAISYMNCLRIKFMMWTIELRRKFVSLLLYIHWGMNKMTGTLQTTFSNAFLW